jgi:hypothetical protein
MKSYDTLLKTLSTLNLKGVIDRLDETKKNYLILTY